VGGQVGADFTTVYRIENAHAGGVLALRFAVRRPPGAGGPEDAGEQYLLSGGRDGTLKAWLPQQSWAEPVGRARTPACTRGPAARSLSHTRCRCHSRCLSWSVGWLGAEHAPGVESFECRTAVTAPLGQPRNALPCLVCVTESQRPNAHNGQVLTFDMGLLAAADGLLLSRGPAGVRSVDYDPARHAALAGTTAGDLVEVSLSSLREEPAGSTRPARVLIRSHAGGVGGVAPWRAAAPGGGGGGGALFATAGDDGTLRVWSAAARRMLRARGTGVPALAIDCAGDGRLVALGHPGGQVTVWETGRFQCVYSGGGGGGGGFGAARFTAGGALLVVAAGGQRIEVLDCRLRAVPVPRGQEEEFCGDGKLRARLARERAERAALMRAHGGSRAGRPHSARVGSRVRPEAHAAHLAAPPATDGIADKIGHPRSAAAAAAAAAAGLPPDFRLVGACGLEHSGKVTHLDASADGRYLRSADVAGGLLHWALPACAPVPRAAHLLRDAAWATHSVRLGWAFQGLWAPPSGNGGGGAGWGGHLLGDVTATDAGGPAVRCGAAEVPGLLAVGWGDGRVELARFPCLSAAAGRRVGRGHAGRVAALRFTADGARVISVGAGDGCVFQWLVVADAAFHAAWEADDGPPAPVLTRADSDGLARAAAAAMGEAGGMAAATSGTGPGTYGRATRLLSAAGGRVTRPESIPGGRSGSTGGASGRTARVRPASARPAPARSASRSSAGRAAPR
jgi:WD40 repeat protein